MQMLTTTLGVLIGLALLAVLGLGAYSALQWVIGLFAGLDPQSAAMTGILSVVALLAAMIVAGGGARTARQVMVARAQSEKAAAYDEFIDLWHHLIFVGTPAPAADGEQTLEAMRSLNLRLAIYGSPAVLKAHQQLAELLNNSRLDSESARATLASTALTIRGELGSGTVGLSREGLSKTLFAVEPPMSATAEGAIEQAFATAADPAPGPAPEAEPGPGRAR